MTADMLSKRPEPQSIQPLTNLQRKAAALLADGATDDRVAAELGVPVAWVQSLQMSLPVTAEVVHQQWRRFQAHGQRVRSLLELALDVVETELTERPSAELAVALLRNLKLEPPARPYLSPEQLLRDECRQQAQEQLRQKEARLGLGFGLLSAGEVDQTALDLFDAQVHRLSAPEDPAESHCG